MSNRALKPVSDRQSIDQFLAEVKQLPKTGQPGQGRLIFALDATASREPTWDQASHLQAELFHVTETRGGLSIQLCYYRGYREFKATPFVHKTQALREQMTAVRCLGGLTQIERVLAHARSETQKKAVQAVIFIGDCCEESVDPLCHLAGELGILKTPVFMFQEGHDPHARLVFQQISQLSGGAYAPFDRNSPKVLQDLLAAVAIYASGGRQALADFSKRQGGAVLRLTQQLK